MYLYSLSLSWWPQLQCIEKKKTPVQWVYTYLLKIASMLGALVELSADKYKSAGNACPAYPLPLLEKVRAPSPTIFLESLISLRSTFSMTPLCLPSPTDTRDFSSSGIFPLAPTNSTHTHTHTHTHTIKHPTQCHISRLMLCCAKSLQSCLTLCKPMNCSPPGSSVHGILQARILEWAAMPSSRGYSWPRGWTCVSKVSCIGRQALCH